MGTAPFDLAALLAREVDEGVATALTAVDAGGFLVLDTVVAKVAVPARPGDGRAIDDVSGDAGHDGVDWDAITWAAEVVLHVDPLLAGQRTAQGPQDPAEARLPAVIAALPVRAIRGVGERWAELLAVERLETVGALATAGPGTLAALARRRGLDVIAFAGRARSCSIAVPTGTVAVVSGRSVLDVARTDPSTVPGAPEVTTAWWRAATTLVAAIDADVLRGIPAAGLG